MPNVTSPSSARAPNSAPGLPLRGTIKGALATMVLLLLALLFWQLLDQLKQTQQHERQYTIDYSADQADHISLNMALNAQIALNLLPIVEQPRSSDELQALLAKLQRSLPDLRSLALLDSEGQVRSDSAAASGDHPWLAQMTQRSRAQRYFYGSAADGSVAYLLLHQPSGDSKGYWALRLAPRFVQGLGKSGEHPASAQWALENQLTQQIIGQSPNLAAAHNQVLPPEALEDSVLVVPLGKSDWQLRGLFDEQAVVEQLLPALSANAC